MTASRHVTIWCDAVDRIGKCYDWTGGDQPRTADARRDARRSGWVYRDGKDLCALHARGGERPLRHVPAVDVAKQPMATSCGCSTLPGPLDVLLVMEDRGGGDGPWVTSVLGKCPEHGQVSVWSDEDGGFDSDQFVHAGNEVHF